MCVCLSDQFTLDDLLQQMPRITDVQHVRNCEMNYSNEPAIYQLIPHIIDHVPIRELKGPIVI
jgi:hypothetical protein